MDRLVYAAGSCDQLPHSLRLRWLTADHIKRSSATRFCEFWCQRNSGGAWRIEQTESRLDVTFANHPDLILFWLADLCGVIESGIAVQEKPKYQSYDWALED